MSMYQRFRRKRVEAANKDRHERMTVLVIDVLNRAVADGGAIRVSRSFFSSTPSDQKVCEYATKLGLMSRNYCDIFHVTQAGLNFLAEGKLTEDDDE